MSILIIHLFLSLLQTLSHNKWSLTLTINTRGLAGNVVTSIAKDQNHNLWFATDEGVVEYETSNHFVAAHIIFTMALAAI
jgi:ligand-binding sensor domain-containing protein